MTTAPVIVGASCVFPSGPSLPLADAAVRAPLALPRNHPFYVDACGMRVKANYFPDTSAGLDMARWSALAEAALKELSASLQVGPVQHREASLILALPHADRPGVPNDLAERLLPSMHDEQLRWHQVDAFMGGHAVCSYVLQRAVDAVAAKPGSLVVVLGVDTQLSPHAMQWLESSGRLHGAHQSYEGRARANPYGRAPGEGAAAIAIGDASWAGPRWANLLGAAIATEPMTCDMPGPCQALGLTRAAHEAMARADQWMAGPIGSIISDLNGEPYRSDEFGFLSLRLAESLSANWRRMIPSLASGDLGAATSIAHVALAGYRLRQAGMADKHLIVSSSDDGLRGAVVLGACHQQSQ